MDLCDRKRRHERHNCRNPDSRSHRGYRAIGNPERGGTDKRISERADEMNPEKEKMPLRKYAIYRHYKGGEYTLLGIAKLESDLTDMAIYTQYK